MHAGRILATFRTNKPSIQTDWQALARHFLDDYDGAERERLILDHTAPTPGARVLRPVKEMF
jgi:hypothetical protein